MLWANYHIALAVNCQESEYVEVILFLGCEASFDRNHHEGNESIPLLRRAHHSTLCEGYCWIPEAPEQD